MATPIGRATLSVLKVHSFVVMMMLSQESRKRHVQLRLSD